MNNLKHNGDKKQKNVVISFYKSFKSFGASLAVLAGIISHDPIYAWSPLLKELRKQGMRQGLAAVFLYNRAIKIPLLPVLVYYFGVAFTVILLAFTVIDSLIEGKIIEMLEC